MKVIIVSSYPLIREGIYSIISRSNNIDVMFMTETVKEAIYSIKENKIDIILLDLHEQNKDELMLIKEMKECGVKSKFIVLDFNTDNDVFVKAIRCGVEGYMLGRVEETEFLYILDKVHKGKKHFDSHFIDCIIKEDSVEPRSVEQLTIREKEVLCEIGRGMTNYQISQKFCISQNTVKKHINHIFDKLNIRDRTQVALYANKCGMIDSNAS